MKGPEPVDPADRPGAGKADRWDRVLLVVIFVAGNPIAQTLADTTLVGNVIAVGGGLSWAVYTIMNKGASKQHSPLVLTVLAYLTGSCFLIPCPSTASLFLSLVNACCVRLRSSIRAFSRCWLVILPPLCLATPETTFLVV